MRELPPTAVFSRDDARRVGWSDAAITRAVRSGRLLRPRRGLLCRPVDSGVESSPGPLADPPRHLRTAAAAKACEGSVVSHRSALELHDLPVVGLRPRTPELTVPPRGTGSLVRAHLHRATLEPNDVVEAHGAPVTSVARTLVDVARSQPIRCAVSAVDAALNRGLVRPEQIDDVLVRCWNWPRIARALHAFRLLDARSESPLESISRLGLAGRVPGFDLQSTILDATGGFVARVDFYWDGAGVVGEADGTAKYMERSDLLAEKARQEALERLGLVVVRWGWDDAWARPGPLAERVHAALERGTLRDRSGFPRLWSVRST